MNCSSPHGDWFLVHCVNVIEATWKRFIKNMATDKIQFGFMLWDGTMDAVIVY